MKAIKIKFWLNVGIYVIFKNVYCYVSVVELGQRGAAMTEELPEESSQLYPSFLVQCWTW